MNIYEAANSGKPFTNKDIIGAYKVIDGKHWVHRDCVGDFSDDEFIRANCLGFFSAYWLDVSDILRDDWVIAE